ncbi:MAG: hypothetical protein KTR30_36765, partial [Saprospiraceae bacterium]|nr:hypothetical protein [Saprospiraceae bacterium]
PKRIVPVGPAISWDVENPQSPSLQLCFNPQKWNQLLRLEEKKLRLQHELLHLLFNHPFLTDRFHYSHLYDLACDWIIQRFQLDPTHSFTGFPPETLGLAHSTPPVQVASYYNSLENFWLEQMQSPRPHPSLQKIKSYQDSAASRSHSHWHQRIAKLGQAEKDILMAGIDLLLLNTLERVGSAAIAHWPNALRLLLEGRQPHYKVVVNWRRVLRLFVGRHKRTQIKNTLRRPSKRYGTTPGIRIHKQQKLLVALDTSASIQAPQFDDFFAEIHHLWKLGASIHIVECDTSIHRDYPYQGRPPGFVKGRGGSAFDPPIRWANEVFQPDAILYFTDGDAPKMRVKSRFPLIWLLSAPQSDKWQQDQGVSIELS